MAFLQLPHWLMIGGGMLALVGLIGLSLSRNKEITSDPVPLPANDSKENARAQSEEGSPKVEK